MPLIRRSPVRLVHTRDERTWERIASAQPGFTTFHRASWLTRQARLLGWNFDPLVVLVDGAPAGVVPVVSKRAFPAVSPSMPFPYVGPLIAETHLSGALDALRRWQVRTGHVRVNLGFAPDIADGARRALDRSHIDWNDDSTFVLDLSHGSVSEFEAGMTGKRRNALRGAERAGVVVRPSRAGEVAEILPRLLDEAYGARGITSPYPDSVGDEAETVLESFPDAFAVTALIDDSVVGVLTALSAGGAAFGWVGGSVRAHRAQNVSTALYRGMMTEAIERACLTFDLVGQVDEGIARFKRSLGAVERSYVEAASLLAPVKILRRARALR